MGNLDEDKIARRLNTIIAGMMAAAWMVSPTFASPKSVKLEPLRHTSASLEIPMPEGGTKTYSPADLETFPTYQIETTTPWRDEPTVFEGILLTDLLEAHGLLDAPSIRVVAENDYTTSIGREVWEAAPILVATRVNGRAHSRRNRGPIQFVVEKSDYDQQDAVTEDHLVWMAARILPGE